MQAGKSALVRAGEKDSSAKRPWILYKHCVISTSAGSCSPTECLCANAHWVNQDTRKRRNQGIDQVRLFLEGLISCRVVCLLCAGLFLCSGSGWGDAEGHPCMVSPGSNNTKVSFLGKFWTWPNAPMGTRALINQQNIACFYRKINKGLQWADFCSFEELQI